MGRMYEQAPIEAESTAQPVSTPSQNGGGKMYEQDVQSAQQAQQPSEQEQWQQANEEESPGGTFLRHATRLGTHALTGLAGTPAALLNLPATVGNLAYEAASGEKSPVPSDIISKNLGIPTQENMLQYASKVLPKDYLKSDPGSWQEFGDKVAGIVPSFFKNAAGAIPLAKQAIKAIGKAVGLESAGYVGEKAGEMINSPRFGRLAGYALGAHALNHIEGKAGIMDNAEKVENTSYDTAADVLKKSDYKIDPTKMERKMQDAWTKLDKVTENSSNAGWVSDAKKHMKTITKNLITPAKERVDVRGNVISTGREAIPELSPHVGYTGPAMDVPSRLGTTLKNAKIETANVVDEVRRLNKEIYKGHIPKQAMPFYIDMRKALEEGIEPALKNVPGFKGPWQLGQEIHMARKVAQETLRFVVLDTKFENMIKDPGLKQLAFIPGGVLGGVYLKLGALSAAKTAAVGAGLYGAAKAAQHAIRLNAFLNNSPSMMKIAKQGIASAARGNAVGYANALRHIDKGIREDKKSAPDFGTTINFV